MRIGTNTAIYSRALDDPHLMDETEIIRRLHEFGFQTIDLSLASPGNPEFFLCRDDWQYKVDEIANTAAKYGMVFSQVHVPFTRGGSRERDPGFKKPGFAEHYDECMRRAYIAGGMVGAPWAVAHCNNFPSAGYDREESLRKNHEYYDRYVELGIKQGIGTAFENMIQGATGHTRIRYTAHYSELIEYVDSYHDSMVKICWDFGHANLTGLDQPTALRKIGSRLACLHVDDNLGSLDDHMPPFAGTVDWFTVIPVLAEIGFAGDCSLEVGKFTNHAPRSLQDSFVRVSYEACRYLCGLFDQAAEAKRRTDHA